ncbi:ABC transporter ATP-binding protein [Candidatus Uabimicrobium sp. HlEnr_7]|uniref:ABC transporter ATP-binding protein n=1 Tax=Candidatus Uabimicrobium helgolandensis TaxID=3095367 RepID=UPI0035579722
MSDNEKPMAIEVKNLRKAFGSKIAVNNLSFQVPEGSITGFIGPNGAGKTTTLRMLCTLLKPDAGTVKVFGLDTRDSAEKIRHQLGFMPDYFGLYDDMEVYEYLNFFAAAYHIGAHRRKNLVEDILQLLDLTAKKHSLINELSRGMQQRLSLGRALVHDPKLLLLDEPASGLDPRARMELMELLRELRRMGKTVFISSHILAELKNLCDFVVIIENGRKVYNGTVADAATTVEGDLSRLQITSSEDAQVIVDTIASWKSDLKTTIKEEKVTVVEYHSEELKSSEIISHLIKNDLHIEEAKKLLANLEDVFMSLTKGGIS